MLMFVHFRFPNKTNLCTGHNMPYPRAIITMAQNLIAQAATNANIHENRFYMLWNSILNHHFPIDFEYGVAVQTSQTEPGTRKEFLVVKVARDVESVVLVVELTKPAEDTTVGRQNVKSELVDYIDDRFEFDETQFPTIYGICGIGLSWVIYKFSKNEATLHPSKRELVMDWTSNVTAAASYTSMQELAAQIDAMSGTVRNQ
jgi:hypothetical protein